LGVSSVDANYKITDSNYVDYENEVNEEMLALIMPMMLND